MNKVRWTAASLFLLVFGCSAGVSSLDEEVASHEDDPDAQGSDALRSSVSCVERRETAYVNGVAKEIRVITVGGKAVTLATGHAFLRMQAAADTAGVPLSLTSGFRTMAEQRYLYACYQSGNCNDGNLAARPGYSNHQSGTAVDVSTSAWLAQNAGRFGFVRTVPSEPWHYEYRGDDPGGPCGAGGGEATWISPREGGWYENGIWFKVRLTTPNVAKVTYTADGWELGDSTDRAQDFAFRYTFNTLGARSVTARAWAANGTLVATTSVQFRITEP